MGAGIILSAMCLGEKDNIFKLAAKVMGLFGGPLIGMFFLGVFTRRTNSLGVAIGAIIGVISTGLVSKFTPLSWLYYAAFGCIVAMVFGYCFSFFDKPPKPEKIKGLVVGTFSTEMENPLTAKSLQPSAPANKTMLVK